MISAKDYFEYLGNRFRLEYESNGNLHRVSVGVLHLQDQFGYAFSDGNSHNGSIMFAVEMVTVKAMTEAGSDLDEIDLCVPFVRSKFKKMLNSRYGANPSVIKVTI